MPGAGVCVLSSGLVSASWILNHRPSIGPWFDGAPLSCAVVVLNYAAGGRRPGQCCHGHAANITTGGPSAQYSAAL